MKYTQSGNTYLLVLNKGEEIVSALTQFATETNLTCASVSGIGATDDAEMGVFDTFEKQYYTKQIRAMTEITSLCGNVTQKELAEKLNINPSTVSKYMRLNKYPSLDTFANICEILDVSADDILGLK